MRMLLTKVVLLALCALCSATDANSYVERVLQEAATESCNNTKGSRWYVTDDKGVVCSREQLDYFTGCCKDATLKFSCDSCVTADSCCSSYEHCVSCCMDPKNRPEQHMKENFRGLGKPETGHWSTPFAYCQSTCLTTSRSTQHENDFILDRRFCFSKGGRPLDTSIPPAPLLPDEVTLIVGAVGHSCDDACEAKGQACAVENFNAMNDCNVLRSRFLCEAGCGMAKATEAHFPGYVSNKAPKASLPAYCSWLGKGPDGADPAFNCSVVGKHVQRICPCKPRQEPEVDVDGEAAAASGEGEGDDIDEAAAAGEGDDIDEAAAAGEGDDIDEAAAGGPYDVEVDSNNEDDGA